MFTTLPPDGLEGAGWAQFVGRFHLLTVHFPIALILLVPVFELAGRHPRLSFPRTAVDFMWLLAMFSSLAAALLGWCLARNGAYSGRLVTQHMWGGLFVGVACWLCWILRHSLEGGRKQGFYSISLAATVVLISWTGYRGGQLSQGENHLTEQLPQTLRPLLGLPSLSAEVPRSNPAFFYGAHIEPIFISHCYECHGAGKQKGRLRLDSYEALMRGGKHGPVVKASDVKGSELYHRVTLAPSDDNAMPPQGKRPLTANEVKLLELWIAAGASSTVAADGIQGAPTDQVAVAEITFPEIDTDAVTKLRAPLASEVTTWKNRFPDVLEYESRGSADLVLDASAQGTRFGDDPLANLKSLSGPLVRLDLANTAITDRSASVLAAMKHARVLRLDGTKITDATVMALGGLDQLQSLSLYGTAITPSCLKTLEGLPRLQHVYVGATKVTEDSAIPETLKAKLRF